MDQENESAELTLAYMSIETMKNRILQLEADNEKLRKEVCFYEQSGNSESHYSFGAYEESYNNGFNGHGY